MAEERFSEWVARWDDEQFNSKEWRAMLISRIQDMEYGIEKYLTIKPIYEKQSDYINSLEKQLELLQKTLDIVERVNRPVIIPNIDGGRK